MAEDDTTSELQLPSLSKTGAKGAFLVVVKSDAVVNIGQTMKIDSDDFLLGRSPDLALPLSDESISRQHARVLRDGKGGYVLQDLQSTNGTFLNGVRVTAEPLPIKDGDKLQLGSGAILLFSLRDQLEEQFQKALYEAATRDGLTGLTNKTLFLSSLKHELAHVNRRGTTLSLAMIDVDHFKKVNDTFGHPAGDQALRALAEHLKAAAGEGDLIARFGGEEFSWLLRGLSMEKARSKVEAFRARVETSKVDLSEAQSLSVTISIGLVTLEGGSTLTAVELVAAADAELYRAKQGGRNQVSDRQV